MFWLNGVLVFMCRFAVDPFILFFCPRERIDEPFIEAEQMLYPVAVGREGRSPIEPVHRLIERIMGAA